MNTIKEKDVNRLPERDEALSRGFELVFTVNTNGTVDERIKYGEDEYIRGFSTRNYLGRGQFNSRFIKPKGSEIPWFDTEGPRMRKMNVFESLIWCHENNKIHGKTCRDAFEYNSVIISDYDYTGFIWGFLNDDLEFEECPLTEDK